MTKEKLVVISGAGISAESGIQTFRGAGGMWGNHNVREVASPQGWAEDPQVVSDFYNHRLEEMAAATPNDGHKKIAELEAGYEVTIFTQNVDSLHEDAGSTSVYHLHGSIKEKRNTNDGSVEKMEVDDRFGPEADGTFLYRPNIVWFGEQVMHLDIAAAAIKHADVCLVIGTSLQVYPANSLHKSLGVSARRFLIDPHASEINPQLTEGFQLIEEPATTGMQILVDELRATV